MILAWELKNRAITAKAGTEGAQAVQMISLQLKHIAEIFCMVL